MRFVLIVSGKIIFVIAFIFNINRVEFEYPELLAEEEGTYFMLAIDKYEQDEVYTSVLKANQELHSVKNRIEYIPAFKLIRNIEVPVKTIGELEIAQEMYPELDIEDAPAVLIFDNKGMVFKSYDMKEARRFLRELQ